MILAVVVGLLLQVLVLGQEFMPIDPETGRNIAGNFRGTRKGSEQGRAAGRPKAGERRAHRGKGRGNPRISESWPVLLAKVQEVAAEHAPWVLQTDTFMLEIFVGLLVGIAEMRAHLEEHGWIDQNGNTRQVARDYMRALSKAGNEAERLGFSPRARIDLGLAHAQTAALVEPVRTAERALEVAHMLDQIGALPRRKLSAGSEDVIEAAVAEPETVPTEEPAAPVYEEVPAPVAGADVSYIFDQRAK